MKSLGIENRIQALIPWIFIDQLYNCSKESCSQTFRRDDASVPIGYVNIACDAKRSVRISSNFFDKRASKRALSVIYASCQLLPFVGPWVFLLCRVRPEKAGLSCKRSNFPAASRARGITWRNSCGFSSLSTAIETMKPTKACRCSLSAA